MLITLPPCRLYARYSFSYFSVRYYATIMPPLSLMPLFIFAAAYAALLYFLRNITSPRLVTRCRCCLIHNITLSRLRAAAAFDAAFIISFAFRRQSRYAIFGCVAAMPHATPLMLTLR